MICHPRHLIRRLALNGTCLTLVLLVLIPCLLNLVNVTRPALRCTGTDVTEPDFSHPRRRDTISTSFLLSVTFFVPLLQFVLLEYWNSSSDIEAPPLWGSTSPRLLRAALRAASLFVHYFVGFVFTVAVNEIGKTTLNYPRPHFVDTCRPTFPSSACVLGWVDQYECSSVINGTVTRWRLVDAHKSFPSGHAAIGMYSALFMIGYQHSAGALLTLQRSGHFVLLYMVHASWLAWALFCGYSRIMDYRHHPGDVAVGAFVGVLGGLFATYVLKKEQKGDWVNSISGPAVPSSGPASNGDLKRGIGGGGGGSGRGPLHRKLSEQQSTMTQMSDISEDGELYQV